MSTSGGYWLESLYDWNRFFILLQERPTAGNIGSGPEHNVVVYGESGIRIFF